MNLGHFIASFFSIAIIAVSTGISSLLFQAQAGNAQVNQYSLYLRQQENLSLTEPLEIKNAVEIEPSKPTTKAKKINPSDLITFKSLNLVKVTELTKPEIIQIESLAITALPSWDVSVQSFENTPLKNEYDIRFTQDSATIKISLEPAIKDSKCHGVETVYPENITTISSDLSRYTIASDYVKYVPTATSNSKFCTLDVFFTDKINNSVYTVDISVIKNSEASLTDLDTVITSLLAEILAGDSVET